LLDHVIVLNQRHLTRLLKEYVRYYHEDRTHLGLGKDTPNARVAASVAPSGDQVISLARLGGLHHRYAAARVSTGGESPSSWRNLLGSPGRLTSPTLFNPAKLVPMPPATRPVRTDTPPHLQLQPTRSPETGRF
jgi:hypothetical protein